MSTLDTTTRWVLAFDSSCGRCRQIADAVARAWDGSVEVLPLAHPDVARWRTESFGPNPRWAPTLFRVGEGRVRAWTGGSMTGPLIRALGPRGTIDLLRVLGQLRKDGAGHGGKADTAGVSSRAPVFPLGSGVLVAGGLFVAGGLVLTGMLSAPGGPDPAQAWVEENSGQLPQDYDAVVAHPMEYRRAIYQALPPATRSTLWVEHLGRYRAAHPELSAEQVGVLESASQAAADESTFTGAAGMSTRQADHFRNAAQQAFGPEEARTAFATLGPRLEPRDQRGCTCAATDDWCDNSTHCFRTDCLNNSGCGWLWSQNCDGLCRN